MCQLDPDVLGRIAAGYHPKRSGHLQLVPAEPNTMGNWYSHSGPWEYLQRVPFFLYGPGIVPARGPVERQVSLADVAPTLASLAGHEFDGPDGRVLAEALPVDGAAPPRLIMLMVWDAAGRNVLDTHPRAWPTLRRHIPDGVWFENAEVGSSPSISAAVHATIGTGAFPRHHGIVDHWWTDPRGSLVFADDVGPQPLLVPTMADDYDASLGNKPEVGLVAFDNWHIQLIGQGALAPGGDRDVAVLQYPDVSPVVPDLTDDDPKRWGSTAVSAERFRYPKAVDTIPMPTIAALDGIDHKRDGLWFGRLPMERETPYLEKLTWTLWQPLVIERVIREEGFGDDEVPDLLFTNYKYIDEASHHWTMNSEQMTGVVRATDLAFAHITSILDREVGRGRWVIGVVADHGSTPRVDLTGAFEIDENELERDVEARFDTDGDDRSIVVKVRPTQIWLDLNELEQQGSDPARVARYLARYRIADNIGPETEAPDGKGNPRLFEAVFPSADLVGPGCGGLF